MATQKRRAARQAVRATLKGHKKPLGAPKLHYDKNAVIKEYERTYNVMGIALAALVGGALVYFFAMMVYLGHSNTNHTDFHKQFSDRIDIDYSGTKLPMYEEGK